MGGVSITQRQVELGRGLWSGSKKSREEEVLVQEEGGGDGVENSVKKKGRRC